MSTRELRKSWERTRQMLDAAYLHLPPNAQGGEDGGSVSQYKEWLEHNELELALDELELLADANRVPDIFWRHMLDAARNMDLDEHTRRYSRMADGKEPMHTVTLYRPTGPKELKLVEESGFKRWPPRLPEQPIFYPVTNEQYAAEIAEQWNVKESGVGYVTRFEVNKSFMDKYKIHRVGTKHHEEWWIPAEEFEDLNDNIVGTIEVIREFGTPDEA